MDYKKEGIHINYESLEIVAEHIQGPISFGAGRKKISVEDWKELAKFIKEEGSDEQVQEFHDLRQHLADGKKNEAASVWSRLRSFLSPFLTHTASIAQIVGTIDGILHHGPK